MVIQRAYAGDIPVSTYLALCDARTLLCVDTSSLLEIARYTSVENYSADLLTALGHFGRRIVVLETNRREYANHCRFQRRRYSR